MYLKFETERLFIRPTSEEDAELIQQIMSAPKFIKYVGNRKINSIEDAKKYIQTKMLPQLHKLGFSSYTLITKIDGNKVGTCGLFNREGIDGIDIGFGLLPKYEGIGYAYEAASRLIKAAFEDFKFKTIKGITSKENISSQRLLEKIGLEIVGTTKLPNEDEEILLYAKDSESI